MELCLANHALAWLYYSAIHCSLYQQELSKKIALQIAFKAFNNTASLNKLVSTLLVFSAFFKIVELDLLNSLVAQRTAALRKAIKKVKKLKANC